MAILRTDVITVLNHARQVVQKAAAIDGNTNIVTRAELEQQLAGTPGPEAELVRRLYQGDAVEVPAEASAYVSTLAQNSLPIARVLNVSADALALLPLVARMAIALVPPRTPGEYLSGTVTKGPAGLTFTDDAGKAWTLTPTARATAYYDVGAAWMDGFVGDGPMVLKGKPAADGTSFAVDGYALNTDGQYRTFTFGRVNNDEGSTTITTADGDVVIEDAVLLLKMKAMPRLAVILPGDPVREGDRLVYRGNPAEFIGLARFSPAEVHDGADQGAPGQKWSPVDMAYSSMSHAPFIFPPELAGRVNHGSRFWARGNVTLNADNKAVSFTATYISLATDQGRLAPAPVPAPPPPATPTPATP